MLTLHRILCPVDFSEPSKRALRYALAVDRWHESEVAVLHVEDPLLHAMTIDAGEYAETTEGHYQELRGFIDAAGGGNRKVQVHIATGRPVSRILEHATREGSDLIVMGTNGRSGLARAVLGLVTEGVVRQATTPVLTIPPSANVGDVDVLVGAFVRLIVGFFDWRRRFRARGRSGRAAKTRLNPHESAKAA